MTKRSYFVSLAALAAIASGTTAWAEPPPAPYLMAPVPAPPPPFAPAMAVPWNGSLPPPPGYHLESRTRRGMVWTGAALFGSLYALSLTALNNPAGKWNLIPIAGPALYAQHQKCALPCDDFATPLFDIGFTAGEAVGAVLLAGGLLSQRQWLVSDDPYRATASRPIITLLPRADRQSAGVVAVGAF